MRMGSPTQTYTVPPLPQQQVLTEVIATPQPTTLNNLVSSLPTGARNSLRRLRKIFPTYGTRGAIINYSGGTITQNTPNYE